FLTAAGLGKCTLSTAVGGLKEIVRDGENGIQVAAAEPSLLAAGLRRCIALSPEDRVRMGEALRLDVEARYNWSSIAHRTLEVYRSVLAEGV
ncbi:MAG: glycosyltransferase, partial [Anaerolineae bacterium]